MNGRKTVPVPQNLSSFTVLFQIWKNDSVCVCLCVCVSGVGLQLEVSLPKGKG